MTQIEKVLSAVEQALNCYAKKSRLLFGTRAYKKSLLTSLRACLSNELPELTITRSCQFPIAVEEQMAVYRVDLALLSQEQEMPNVAAVLLVKDKSSAVKNQLRTMLQYMTKRRGREKHTIYREHFLVGVYCEIDYRQQALRVEYYVEGKQEKNTLIFY